MRIRDLILPEDRIFFSLFKEMAEQITLSSATLNEITHKLPNGVEKAHEVRQIEHDGDDLAKLRNAEDVKSHALEINRLYNLSIERLSKAVVELFKNKDLLMIIKLKNIYEGMARVMEKCNDVGHALNNIAMAHS